VHLVGIGGMGMAPLAELLIAAGCRVSGSDTRSLEAMWGGSTIRRLLASGHRIAFGHRVANVPADTELLVHTSLVGPDNVELRRAADLGIPMMSRAEALGLLMDGSHGVGVAGATGKSTTTAMAATVLRAAGMDPTVYLGAMVPAWDDRSSVCGRGQIFLAEADEYNAAFLAQPYRTAIVTNVEHHNHFEVFADEAALEAVFLRFMERVRTLVINAGDPTSLRLAAALPSVPTLYGFGEGPGWRARILEASPDHTRYEVVVDGTCAGRGILRVAGRHSVEDACGAIALSASLGVPPSVALEALADFRALRLRLEQCPDVGRVHFYEDFARNGRQIGATLEAVRQRHPGARIFVLFEPKGAVRIRRTLPSLVKAYPSVEGVGVLDFALSHTADPPNPAIITRAEVVAELRRAGRQAAAVDGARGAAHWLRERLRPGDVVVIHPSRLFKELRIHLLEQDERAPILSTPASSSTPQP
jgi:UDP-N-acetylmuramate--alanine ligase